MTLKAKFWLLVAIIVVGVLIGLDNPQPGP